MGSPAFQGRAHVDHKRPGMVVMPVEKSVALDDALYIDHSVLADVSVREAFAYLFTIDGTVDDDMADMDALRAVFFRHRLGEGSETCFGRIESAIPGPTAQRGACAGEQDCSSPSRNHASQGLPSEQTYAIPDDPPPFLEIVRFHFENTTGRIVACIIDRKIYIGTGMLEDPGHIRLGRRVCGKGRRFASGSLNVRNDSIQRGRGTPCFNHM